MGLIDGDTLIAVFGTPEVWHPLSKHPEIHAPDK